MNELKIYYKKFERTVSNVKFAVVIISLLTLALIFGTIMESYHGADYANRLVYKSWWFLLIEAGIFISVFMATVVRFPAKKRLYGFYTIHAGILILYIGSFFTWINGIDGSIQLLPNTPSKTIFINEDVLKIQIKKTTQIKENTVITNDTNFNKTYSLKMPYTPGEANINQGIKNVFVKKYLPYAEDTIIWKTEENMNPEYHSATYMLFNDNFSIERTFSLHPKADFKALHAEGLLYFHYMPSILADCFARPSESGFIVWNIQNGECFAAEDRNLDISETSKGTRFMLIKWQGEILKFFPDIRPVPVTDDLKDRKDTPFRVISKKLFEDKANLFLFGESASFFNRAEKKWYSEDLTKGLVKLPWMGFNLRLLNHSRTSYPIKEPVPVKPIQEGGELLKGKLKAVQIRFFGKDYWIKSDKGIQLNRRDKDKKTGDEIEWEVKLSLGPKEIQLPYQITLDRFQMNKNPGTNNPASYESFVQLLDGRDKGLVEDHHVFMNNPLKYDDFTFYQSSYFPVGQGQFASVFSVNYDPGRFFKYLGSFFIVFGSIWHYFLNRKKKTFFSSPRKEEVIS